jgi:nucleotide-binding universal stress UspA family protein
MFQKILVPLDGSSRGEAALHPLRWLAHDGAELLLLRACPLRPTVAFEAAPWVAENRAEAKAYLERVAASLRKRGLRARPLLHDGPAAESILDAAAEEDVDAVALATHGRTGLARFVFGSVTEKVLRAATTPVAVFPSFGPARTTAPERILLPLEGPEPVRGLTPLVVELARRGSARVTLLHVTPEGESGDPAAPFLQEVAAGLAAEGVEGGVVLLQGDPASKILDFAREESVDLMLVPARGHRGPSRWLFGGVSEKLLRGAASPLLVVREAPVPGPIASAQTAVWKE